MNKVELLIEYAKSWNNLDTSYLRSILSDDFEYTSQWVFETMIGKDKYIDYLNGKFSTIKEALTAIPTAEIAYFKNLYSAANEPCIVITQNINDQTNQVSLIVETENNQIKKTNLIGLPNPKYAIKFGIHPK